MADSSKGAARDSLLPRQGDAGELGYRVANPDAPPSEPKILVPLDPRFQASAERILIALIEKWSKTL